MKAIITRDVVVNRQPHFRNERVELDEETFKILESNRQARRDDGQPIEQASTSKKGK